MEGDEAHPEALACICTGGRPYVPGSSLKGALRTMLLYHAMQKDNFVRDARQLEQAVFRFCTAQQDTFRAFHISVGGVLVASLPPDHLTLHFLTPTHPKHKGHWVREGPLLAALVKVLLGRLSSLSHFHCGRRWEADCRRLIDRGARYRTQDLLAGPILLYCGNWHAKQWGRFPNEPTSPASARNKPYA